MSRLDVAADSVPDGGEWDRCWSALESLPTAISLWDEALCCRYANSAALRRLGAPAWDDVVGQPAEALLPPQTWQALRVHAQPALTGHLGQFDCTVPATTGAPSRLQVVCGPYEVAGPDRAECSCRFSTSPPEPGPRRTSAACPRRPRWRGRWTGSVLGRRT